MNRKINNFSSENKKILIYTRIPKTASSSFNFILYRQFPEKKRARIEYPHQAEAFAKNPNRNDFDLLCGHAVEYGIHQHINRPYTYITMLRNPIERVVSFYYHIVNERHPLHEEVVEKKISLHDCVKNKISRDFHNDQVRYISGLMDCSSTQALEVAKKNIEKDFIAFGFTERFDESILIFKDLLGWGNVYYMKLLVSKKRKPLSDIPKKTLALIEKNNALDLEFYEFAKKRFSEMVKQYEEKLALQGLSFEKQLESFRKANSAFRVYYGIYDSVRGLVNRVVRKAGRGYNKAVRILKGIYK